MRTYPTRGSTIRSFASPPGTGAYLARHLLDLAACEGEWLAGVVPGFVEAMR
jgi:hypothetical protein